MFAAPRLTVATSAGTERTESIIAFVLVAAGARPSMGFLVSPQKTFAMKGLKMFAGLRRMRSTTALTTTMVLTVASAVAKVGCYLLTSKLALVRTLASWETLAQRKRTP